jgi:mono/diheme cytochrome c family protein
MARAATTTLLCLAALTLVSSGAYGGGDAERGSTIFAMAGGCGCHTPEKGPVGAGGRALPTPFGTFYSTNITPDRETGIGAWSDEEILAAIRDGDAKGKGVEAPVMPYDLYAGMSDQDGRDLVAHLRTLPPVRRENRPHEVGVPLQRLVYRAWRVFFGSRVEAPAEAPREVVERGRYWADHVAICRDCHTARNWLGVALSDLYLAGTAKGPDGRSVPNITPDVATGIGDWQAEDITQVLASGMLPDMDNVQGLMAEVVDGIGGGPGYSQVPEEELRSIAAYLKSVPAIENEVDAE